MQLLLIELEYHGKKNSAVENSESQNIRISWKSSAYLPEWKFSVLDSHNPEKSSNLNIGKDCRLGSYPESAYSKL